MIFFEEKEWLDKIASIAQDEGHPHPEIAACEAASATAYGKSVLAVHAKNLFNIPQHAKATYDSFEMPTRGLDGEIDGNAAYVLYTHLHDCLFEHVAEIDPAVAKLDALGFIHAAFDADKAAKVLSILGQFYPDLLAEAATKV